MQLSEFSMLSKCQDLATRGHAKDQGQGSKAGVLSFIYEFGWRISFLINHSKINCLAKFTIFKQE